METLMTTIKPADRELGKTIKLNAIDQIAPRDYVTIYYFFSLPQDVDILAVYRILEQGLLRTSREIPELMSSVCRSRNERDELELCFNHDSAATICLKDYTKPNLRQRWIPGSFKDLEQSHFDLNMLPREHVLAQTEFPDRSWQASLAMQANFIDGGLILTGCLHHTVCDGTGTLLFWKTLGRNVSDVTAGLQFVSESSASAQLSNRVAIFNPTPSGTVCDFPGWKLACEGETVSGVSRYDIHQYPSVKFASYFISAANISRLIAMLSTGSAQGPSPTEAICAFIWRNVVKARNINADEFPESRLSIPVNTRTRMQDPLCSPRYWGNLSEPNAVARMPIRLLCGPNPWPIKPASSETESRNDTIASDQSPETSPLLSTIKQIKQAIRSVDNAAVRRLVNLIQHMPQATSLTWDVNRWPGPDMLIVCLHSIGFGPIDFGQVLGVSSAYRCSVGIPKGKPDGRCILMPTRKGLGEGLEVMMQYDTETLQRLAQCGEFNDLFQRLN